MDSDDANVGPYAPQRTLSRRTVLRTAAHAAWAVPAIQVVAAAPAFAGSGTPIAQLTVGSTSGSWNGVNLVLSATITNAGPAATIGLKVTFTIPSQYGALSKPKPKYGSSLGSDRTFTLLEQGEAGVGQTVTLSGSVKADVDPVGAGPAIVVVADADNAPSTGGPDVVPA